ncbi:MAG: metallophosphoesterase, partial [Anaerolineaceae bacterium]|nr:metallophosphoesterase [Anaerolineaceae bacterium]
MGDDPVLLHELWRTRKSGIAPGLAVVLLAVIFLFGTAMGDEAPLKLMIVSDIHYLAPSLYENSDGLFENVMKRADGKMTHYSRELLEGLMREARHQHPDAMIVSGDLSFNGEKESHLELAEAFEKLSAEGIPVWVIPGNHDINYPYAGQYIEDR